MKYDAVVVASGKGKRAKLGINKVFYVMKNHKTVLENACKVFINDKDCKQIIVVTNNINKVFKHNKVTIVKGGKERKDSVKNGLAKVNSDYVFIHDGARPFIKKEDINKIKKELKISDGVILASKNVNTVKLVKNGKVVKTLDRNYIYNALTPQAFKTKKLIKAYNETNLSNVTDDSSVFENMGYKVKVIEGDSSNIKLTKKEDFKNI